MRIGALPPVQTPAIERDHQVTHVDRASRASSRQEVAPTRTPVTRADLRQAIGRALQSEGGGAAPSEGLVDVLTAHASLETASGDRMYNFNFGGIKGVSPEGKTALCRTHEVENGREITIRDGFRAYGTLDAGARDYVRTMKAQFRGALEPAARGDVVGFARELKKAHYYTASEADYARGLGAQLGLPAGDASSASSLGLASSAAGRRTDLGLTSADLARVEGALDAERWLDALSPSMSISSSSASSSRARQARDEDDDA